MAQAPLKKKPNYKKTYGASHTSRKNKPEKASSSSSSSSSSGAGGGGKNSKLSRLIRDKKKLVGVAKIEESLSGVARSHMEEIHLLGAPSKTSIDAAKKKLASTASTSSSLIPSIVGGGSSASSSTGGKISSFD